MGNEVARNSQDIGGPRRQEHEIGVVEARMMKAGREGELITARIRHEVAKANADDRRHGAPSNLRPPSPADL